MVNQYLWTTWISWPVCKNDEWITEVMERYQVHLDCTYTQKSELLPPLNVWCVAKISADGWNTAGWDRSSCWKNPYLQLQGTPSAFMVKTSANCHIYSPSALANGCRCSAKLQPVETYSQRYFFFLIQDNRVTDHRLKMNFELTSFVDGDIETSIQVGSLPCDSTLNMTRQSPSNCLNTLYALLQSCISMEQKELLEELAESVIAAVWLTLVHSPSLQRSNYSDNKIDPVFVY